MEKDSDVASKHSREGNCDGLAMSTWTGQKGGMGQISHIGPFLSSLFK